MDPLSVEAAEAIIAERLDDLKVIAIDGLPLAGKSTLAWRLSQRFGLMSLGLDDFYDGPDYGPGYPFPYFRYDQFAAAVEAYRRTGRFAFLRWDWRRMARGDRPIHMAPERGPLLVEGCSLLQPRLLPLYDLTLFVESDLASAAAAQRRRDGTMMADTWDAVVWPSVALYLQSAPWTHAHLVVAGRGCTGGGQRS